MNTLELGMYELSKLFLAPVLLFILTALAFAVFSLGSFSLEGLLRARGRYRSPVIERWRRQPDLELPDLELMVLRRLELLRITTRTAPMLGLIATMIPMGPALVALGDGDAGGVSQSLVVAFAAVILALIAAAVSFMVLTVRRRWLLNDLRRIEAHLAARDVDPSIPPIRAVAMN